MKRCHRSVRPASSERGAAAVEFAMVATLLFTLLFGILDAGRLWMIQSALSHAAREGAREMAINNEEGEAVNRIETYPIFSGMGVDGSVSPSTCTAGSTVRAEARYAARTLTGIEFDMAGKAEMRCGG